MQVIEEIVEDSNNVWFKEGTYQIETSRDEESINIYRFIVRNIIES